MDIAIGDYVKWNEPQFKGGSFFRGRCRGAKFVGLVEREGVVERDSYGKKTGQHTFSIRLADGSLKLVKGRNLYPNLIGHRHGEKHDENAASKHARAAASRAAL